MIADNRPDDHDDDNDGHEDEVVAEILGPEELIDKTRDSP